MPIAITAVNSVAAQMRGGDVVLGPKTVKPSLKRPSAADTPPVIAKRPSAKVRKVSKKPAAAPRQAQTHARQNATVLKKPAASPRQAETQLYKSTSTIVVNDSSPGPADSERLSRLDSCSSSVSIQVSASATVPWGRSLGRTLTVQSTEPYDVVEGVDYTNVGTGRY